MNSSCHLTVAYDKIKFDDGDPDDPDWMVKQCYLIMIAAVVEVDCGYCVLKKKKACLLPKRCWWMTFTYADEGGGTRLCHSECDGMSQHNLTEGYNRLPGIIAEGQVNLHAHAERTS